jgi:hypothetical protein
MSECFSCRPGAGRDPDRRQSGPLKKWQRVSSTYGGLVLRQAGPRPCAGVTKRGGKGIVPQSLNDSRYKVT